ncbi:MAG: hypothetical protein CL569_03250 [Alphaproteobacteria bacterium]|nr:hypothetical protein [Alphaproteobacteria bacterium]|tara:strand:- start:396 stop:860 length:465 start_codon:yes stop_codon:yes gene_type:complete
MNIGTQGSAKDLATAAAGDLFEGPVRKLSLARMLAFSGGSFDSPDWHQANLHTDSDKARESGLESIIALGTQSEGILLGLMVSLFGPNWHQKGILDAKMTSSIHVNDTIQAKARLESRDVIPNGEHFVLEVWCENGLSEKTIVGRAEAILDPSD